MIRISILSLLSLAVWTPTAHSQDQAAPPTALGLRVEEANVPSDVEGIGLLYREMFRQAVLLAAREGLGLPTRDEALREPLPDGGTTLDLHLRVTSKRSLQVSLSRATGGEATPIWDLSMDLPPGSPCSVQPLAPIVEPLSRGPLPEALKRAGFTGRAVAAAPAEGVPDGVERRLRELTFTEPYAALRQLHEACRQSGESPARLGALVRAYSNLGQLSRGLWNASPKVFAARSILYAQRLVAAAPASRTGLWHRAYAFTMAGLHQAALEDLAVADSLASQEPTPFWVPWLRAVCLFETPQLEGDTPAEDRPLQRFFSYLTVEGCQSGLFERSKAAALLKESPECYRVIDALCALGGVTNLHTATTAGPKTMGSRIWGRVRLQPGLPDRVREAIKALDAGGSEPQGRAGLWKSLLASPEPVEPSWPLLGRLIEETSFMQTARRGDFMRNQWRVPCEDFVREVAPLFEDHPCGALIRSYVLDFQRQPKEWSALFDKLRPVEVVEAWQPIASAAWNVPARDPLGRKVWERMWRHLDATAPDLQWVLHRVPQDQVDRRRKFADYLGRFSPQAPAALVDRIHFDWAKVEPRAAELEKSLGHQPSVLQALGRRYFELGRFDDAERCLKREIEIAPNADATLALAKVYLERGDEDKWLSTIEAALKGEQYGLEHAALRVEIARHFMKTGRSDKAEPYAAAAAVTWASWAMACARDCYQGQADWKKAELWQRRISERYDNEQMEWFFWCKRVGQGDLPAASALAARAIADLKERATSADLEKFGIFYALTGRGRESLAAFRKASEMSNDPYLGLHAALAAMALHDDEARDAALGRVLEKGPGFQAAKGRKGAEIDLAKEFRALLDQGAGSAPTPGTFDRLIQSADGTSRPHLCYFIGRFLELHRSWADARRYYEESPHEGAADLNSLLIKDALKKNP